MIYSTVETLILMAQYSNSATVICPVMIPLRGKKHYLTLNNYRNWYYYISNQIKHSFTETVAEQLQKLTPIQGSFEIHYKLYAPNKKRRDLRGVTTIVGKFLEDALQEYGIIKDDDVLHFPLASDEYMGIDKDNPRVEAIIVW